MDRLLQNFFVISLRAGRTRMASSIAQQITVDVLLSTTTRIVYADVLLNIRVIRVQSVFCATCFSSISAWARIALTSV